MDVVVYDATVCPQFETVGSKKHFPSESVVCVGEVKSVLDSAEKIGKAFENLRSVKQLDRSAGGRNLAMYTEKPIDQLSNHLDQTFAFLFVVDGCVREETMRTALFAYLRKNEQHGSTRVNRGHAATSAGNQDGRRP